LGEEQGGRLVPDDGWFSALDRLVGDESERQRLAAKAQAWARVSTMEAGGADRWEEIFLSAAGPRARRRVRIARVGAGDPPRLAGPLKVRKRSID
jgi:hypothetical protein